MANWNMSGAGKSGNYEAEQAERSAVFDKIKPAGHWKGPISAWIAADDVDECNSAAIWFTGAGIEIVERADQGNLVKVKGPGYFAAIGA